MEGASKCDLCSEEFDSLPNLNLHIEQKHKRVCKRRKEIFKCNVCGYECSRERDLISHTRTHTVERPFKCEVSGCGVAFARESALKNHTEFKHSDERPFKCDFPGCLQTHKTSSNLRRHKKVHSDERPFVCSHCDYKTAQKVNLNSHMRRHSCKRGFKCSHPQCTASFKHSFDLQRHCRTLHGDNIIQCDHSGCGQYLTTKAALKDHLKLHNPSGRVLQCPLCFKYFKMLQHLQEHCAVHTNEKPFQCGHCKYEAARRSHVKSHISSTHADIKFPFIVHLPDDRECLYCKMMLPNAEFVIHCKDQHHVDPIVIN